MAIDDENEQEFDPAALAALVGGAQADASSESGEKEVGQPEEVDRDDAVIDLRALAGGATGYSEDDATVVDPPRRDSGIDIRSDESTVPEGDAPAETAAADHAVAARPSAAMAPEATEESSPAKAVAAAAPAAVASTAVASTAQAPSSGRGVGGMVVGVAIGLAVAGGAFFILRGTGETPTDDVLAAAPSQITAADPVGSADPQLPAAAAAAAPEAAEAVENGTPDPVDEPAEVQEAAEEPAPASAETPAVAATRPSKRPAAGRRSAPVAPPAAAAATPEPTPAPSPAPARPTVADPLPARSTGGAAGRDMGSVLDQALGGAAPARPSAEPAGDLPDQPTRRDVSRVLGRLMPQIRQCAGDQVGLATAAILVRSDGSIASASVAGNPFGGTPQGACMEGAIRSATFPRFRQSTFRITYPFSIRAAP